MRGLALLAVATVALGAGGCRTRACRAGTVLVSVDMPAGTDTLQFVVSVDGVAGAPQSVTLPSATMTHGTLELDFSMYPAGRVVSLTLTALSGGSPLATGTSDARALAKGCDTLSLSLTALAGGDGGDDFGSDGGVAASCAGPGDCPTGQSCDTTGGTCTTSCSATQPCNGGCCDGTSCAPGSASSACALGQATCASCVGNAAGSACLGIAGTNACGCASSSDCPPNQACNTTTHHCGAACDSTTPCNGGCCSATTGGTCQTGTLGVACGNNGAICGDCTNNQIGHKCVAVTGGGQCGCASQATDCPGTSTACTNGLCVNTCSTSMVCLSGCCSSATNGTCMPGTSQMVCGAVGGTCASCVGNANGSACLPSGACGCTKATDCPANQACDTSVGRCTTSCTPSQQCNGGCCSAGGSCVAGNSVGGCGSTGGACTTCPGNTTCASYSCNGSSCIPSYASSSTVCSAADPDNCFFASHCTGSSATCPNRVNMCTGNGCCTGPNKCTSPCP